MKRTTTLLCFLCAAILVFGQPVEAVSASKEKGKTETVKEETKSARSKKDKKKKKGEAETEKSDSTKKKSKYDELFKDKHETAEGMITLHMMKGKLYFEMPLDMFGREMLLGSTVTQISDNGNAIVGSKPTDPLHITFTKNDTYVQLRQLNTDYISSDENIDKALEASTIGSILKNAKIAAYNNDSTAVVFEMTDFFVSDNKKISPFDAYSLYGSAFKRTESYRSERSYLSGVKAFSDNISIRSVLSYTYTLTDRRSDKTVLKDAPFTAEMTRSIVLLPEKPYRPRMADYRIGVFFTPRVQLGDGVRTSYPVYYANRWQLIPSDTAAYRRGEKVTPVKPIVFYVDSNFPDKWKPYIKEGIEQWQELFEEVGFKEAIVAKDFPTDDPEFDPDNIKYSCVRYAPIGIQNAMGPSWVDPRSGEILNASVYVYHDIVRLITNWRFVQTAAVDEDVRAVELPDEVMGDALRYVISHEIGHCLGFMHNMSGSSVIPVDSLRSPSYTQQHGTTTSIMDYARFNYVAQPGDKERGVKLTPPRFGEYDRYLIRWTYTPVFDVEGVEEEAPITTKWITDAVKENPVYRYGKQQFWWSYYDPRSQTEDLGDDAVKASRYGVANLKRILKEYDGWITSGDDDYEFRNEIFESILNQLAMYIQHVYLNVGGIYKNEVKAGDDLPAFENIPTEKQLEALSYLFELYGDLDWLDDKELLNKLALVGSPKGAIANLLSMLIVNAPFQVSMTSGVAGNPFSFRDCADKVYDFVWEPTVRGKKLTRDQMDLQNYYVKAMMSSANFPLPGSRRGIAATDLQSPTVEEMHDMHTHVCDMGCGNQGIYGNLKYDPISGFGWFPRAIFNRGQATVADVYAYMTRVKTLLKNRVNGATGETKSHYELLLYTLEYGLK